MRAVTLDPSTPSPSASPSTAVLVAGFGTTVAMWSVGYVGRLPAVLLPSPVMLGLLLSCLLGGGFVLGRHARAGWGYGAAAGLVAGLLNLLVLGSFLGEAGRSEALVPSAVWWVPGSVLLAAALMAAGAAAGARVPGPRQARNWTAAFTRVAILAALLLLGVGGLVTSKAAGLAVVDWPNSFGYNMFLYPLSRMTGGIYYEHAHRLFGALVGVTTLVLATLLQRHDPRAWVRRLGWAAVALVVVQGLLGGLRVTGGLTLSMDEADMRPSVLLAAIHGVLGQVFFATLVALGVFTSRVWGEPPEPAARRATGADRALGALLVAIVVGQLVLGAIQRHLGALLLFHIAFGVAVVAPLAVHVGFRAWGLNPQSPAMQRLGLGLVAAVAAQLLLGFGAFVAKTALAEAGAAVALRTAHQWFGAILLALAVALACFSFRPLSPPGAGAGGLD